MVEDDDWIDEMDVPWDDDFDLDREDEVEEVVEPPEYEAQGGWMIHYLRMLDDAEEQERVQEIIQGSQRQTPCPAARPRPPTPEPDIWSPPRSPRPHQWFIVPGIEPDPGLEGWEDYDPDRILEDVGVSQMADFFARMYVFSRDKVLKIQRDLQREPIPSDEKYTEYFEELLPRIISEQEQQYAEEQAVMAESNDERRRHQRAARIAESKRKPDSPLFPDELVPWQLRRARKFVEAANLRAQAMREYVLQHGYLADLPLRPPRYDPNFYPNPVCQVLDVSQVPNKVRAVLERLLTQLDAPTQSFMDMGPCAPPQEDRFTFAALGDSELGAVRPCAPTMPRGPPGPFRLDLLDMDFPDMEPRPPCEGDLVDMDAICPSVAPQLPPPLRPTRAPAPVAPPPCSPRPPTDGPRRATPCEGDLMGLDTPPGAPRPICPGAQLPTPLEPTRARSPVAPPRVMSPPLRPTAASRPTSPCEGNLLDLETPSLVAAPLRPTCPGSLFSPPLGPTPARPRPPCARNLLDMDATPPSLAMPLLGFPGSQLSPPLEPTPAHPRPPCARNLLDMDATPPSLAAPLLGCPGSRAPSPLRPPRTPSPVPPPPVPADQCTVADLIDFDF